MKFFYLENYGSWIGISSFAFKEVDQKEILAYVDNLKKKFELFQIIDADKVCSIIQILSSVHRTYRAFSSSQNIAKDFSIEFLIRLSGKRQIVDAIKMLGIKEDTKNGVVICAGKNLEEIKNIITYILDKFSREENENFIEIYSKEKEEILRKTYELRSPFIIKEILMKISLIEFQI